MGTQGFIVEDADEGLLLSFPDSEHAPYMPEDAIERLKSALKQAFPDETKQLNQFVEEAEANDSSKHAR